VTCRESFIWTFRKPFNVLGAEPNDLMVLEFDIKARNVLVRVGGLGLFEAVQEAEPDVDTLEEVDHIDDSPIDARCEENENGIGGPVDANVKIDFDAPATLRKWPSLKHERVSASGGPYLVLDGTLQECISAFIAKPISQHSLYEIHTAPQSEIVGAVMSWKNIVEIARIGDV
jgi:hypothetical protein